jgi:cation-transporting P-type ATPase I
VPAWSGASSRALERRICAVRGVKSVRANVRTRNVLVHFDHERTDERKVLARVGRLAAQASRDEPDPPAEARGRSRPVTDPPSSAGRRARIAVRGLEHEPDLARRVVERLEAHPGILRASASLLTGRVLVELADDADVDFDDVGALLSELEPPQEDAQDPPAHPLDPAPLIEGSAKLIGATVGLGWLAMRRAVAGQGAPVATSGAAEAAAVVGLVEGTPQLAERIEQGLGHEQKEAVFGAVAVVGLAFSGSALGLALAGASAARLLTETLAKRSAWREYEERVGDGPAIHPGATLRLQAGERMPLPGDVLDGVGTATRRDGLATAAAPGNSLDSGARLYGGPFTVRLSSDGAFEDLPRTRPPPKSDGALYMRAVGPLALGYAVITALATRSLSRTFTALLLVNPRPALYGEDNANRAASMRAIRAGVTVVGTRADRPIRRPDTVLLDSPRVLADGLERSHVMTMDGGPDATEVARLAASVSAAAGSPWGEAFGSTGPIRASGGSFDGDTAAAEVDGVPWTLAPSGELTKQRGRAAEGELLLALRRSGASRVAGAVALRPRLAPGAEALVASCRRHGVHLEVLSHDGSPAAAALCDRAGASLVRAEGSASRVDALRAGGMVVAVVSDSADAAEAFAACDLAIARTSGRHGRFAARADLLAPDLSAVAAIVEAGARRDAAVRYSVGLSIAANGAGAVLGLRAPTVVAAGAPTYLSGLAAIAAGSWRLAGGERPRSVVERLTDPVPERWGREPVEAVLRSLSASPDGLGSEEARKRWRPAAPGRDGGSPVLGAIGGQLRSPLTGFLAAGAGLSLALGATADVVMIGAVLGLNAVVSAWQEREAGSAAKALEHMTARTARVLRDGEERIVPATELVPGDVLVLAPGDRVAADARVIAVDRLEVDEAALTGESLPVAKVVEGGTDAGHVVLEGSDVTLGTGRAVTVAVGAGTRMGAMAAALAADQSASNPLDDRLSSILRRGLPVILVGAGLVTAAGLLWGQPLLPQLALGASIAIAAVPEGLPLLSGVAEAGVAQRLARRRAVVTRLAAVEALGRVDIACADKTGTMTEGRLSLDLVTDADGKSGGPAELDDVLRNVLLAAALASPHPEAADAQSHPTDVAVVEGARRAGLDAAFRIARRREEPFDPVNGFHATATAERMYLKGAAETIAARCDRARGDGSERLLDEAGRGELLGHAERLAEVGFRVLMVAEGPPDTSLDDPRGLTATGFVGIRDPLRDTVPAAVRRCNEAGVRVVMLTGDHPATAAAIAREAGLLDGEGGVVTGPELAGLEGSELEDRLNGATVIARSTPLDKLRIVEALQRRGHVVAMTGDGVNDAPALRLADVGVAMGEAGTEVARQASDVVVTDDDFSTLVEALVEGRGFWRNMRQALGLLLGGNLGEVGLMVGAGVAGLAAPMTARQILSVNLVTDVLPAVAIALQHPEHRELARLRREGTEALDSSLRGDVIRRGIATALPSLAAYVLAARGGASPQARTVAYVSVVGTQLSQTVDLSRSEQGLGRWVVGAVGASGGVLAASVLLPPLRGFLGLAVPTPSGLALIGAATLSAVGASRALGRSGG